jgi:flagellar basal-body rod protein FlgC
MGNNMFGALDTAISGATTARVWLDAISDNVANANTVRPAGEEPFRARLVVARSQGQPGEIGTGVGVESVQLNPSVPQLVYDPENPLADENGNVTRPVVDMTEEMTNLVMAQRFYQVNLSVVTAAREAYTKALEIGRH